MTTIDSFSPKSTSISFPWPSEVTGLERIALSAQGDLQRVLSAFFARPITIQLVYSHTYVQETPSSPLTPLTLPCPETLAAASPSQPIVQTRQVLLQCGGKTVCTATSTVRITSPECAHLFLEEKFAIGQMFRKLQRVPAFALLTVGLGLVDDEQPSEKSASASQFFNAESKKSDQLWRKYKLTIPDFDCEILEVFPTRDMFLYGDAWLTDSHLIKQRT
jgi:hypothetical protein